MRIAVLTSDKRLWALNGFFHQWEKYNGVQTSYDLDTFQVEVVGFTRPKFLPEGVSFFSVGKFQDYPVDKWSDAVIKYLKSIPDELVIVLLEDYWMIRKINREAIVQAYGYMEDNPTIARFDLAADRMFSRNARYVEPYGCLDICSSKGDYSLSFQASIWRTKILADLLVPGETPWQSELNGTQRLNKTMYSVVGTYQWPMNYSIVVNKGIVDTKGAWMFPARTLKAGDWEELSDLGYLEADHGTD